jgi:predicted dehydrogenase
VDRDEVERIIVAVHDRLHERLEAAAADYYLDLGDDPDTATIRAAVAALGAYTFVLAAWNRGRDI